MKFALVDMCGKGVYLRQQLVAAGHEQSDQPDIAILDCDWSYAHPRPAMINQLASQGAKIALYPHGGRMTSFVYDGLTEPDPRVDLRLEHGQGSIDALAGIRNGLKQQAVGWMFSPTAPFVPFERKPTRILFGPLHPNMEMVARGLPGPDPAREYNADLYKRLLDLPDIEMLVSVIGPAWHTGVWQHPKTRLIPNPNMWFPFTYEQILAADLVVATDTIAYAAVALGKPTIMFNQGDMLDYIDGEYREATHADAYRDSVRWPLDAADGDLSDLIEQACSGSPEQAEWRAKWVGEDGTKRAIGLLEQLAGHQESVNVTIEGARAAAGAPLGDY